MVVEPEVDGITREVSTGGLRIVIIGGCGHVGLPFGVALATGGHSVALLDTNIDSVALVNEGIAPFADEGLDTALREAVAAGCVEATVGPEVLLSADTVVIAVGTSAHNPAKPELGSVSQALREYAPYLSADQLVMVRSTLQIGGTRWVEQLLKSLGLDCLVGFCPERSVEGRAFAELFELPQIISTHGEAALDRCRRVFDSVTDRLVVLTPEAAEFAKLVSNSWRYIRFAAANQFWMIACELGVDYQEVYSAVTDGYPRASDLPAPGFASGPCLPKDTRLLAAGTSTVFDLGHAALRVNENLADFVIGRLATLDDLASKTIGILGMAFKGECDDPRNSAAFALWRALSDKGLRVLCSDEKIQDPTFVDTDMLLKCSDIVIIGAPHLAYRTVETEAPVLDIWGVTGRIATF